MSYEYQRSSDAINSQLSQAGYDDSYVPLQSASNLQRAPSFNAGDDAAFFDSSNAQVRSSSGRLGGNDGRRPYGSRRSANGAYTQQDELFMDATNSTSLPVRAASYAPSPSTYQSQYQPLSPRTYNPQEYTTPTQAQYNGYQAYGRPSADYGLGSSQQQSYGQTYNPAAYSAATQNSHTGYIGQSYHQPSNAYSSGQFSPPLTGTAQPPYADARPANFSDYSSDIQDSYLASFPRPPSSPAPPLPPRPPGYASAPPSAPFSPPRSSISSSGSRRVLARPHSNSTPYPNYADAAHGEVLAPYPLEDQMYSPSFTDSYLSGPPSAHYQTTSIPSPGVSVPSTPGPPPPVHGRQNSVGQLPPPQSPPVAPDDQEFNTGYYEESEATLEEVMKEIDATLMSTRPGGGSLHQSSRPERLNHEPSISEDDEIESVAPLTPNRSPRIPEENGETYLHHHDSFVDTGTSYVNYRAYSDESDAEAEAGVEMMRREDERERTNDARNQSNSMYSHAPQHQALPPIPTDEESSNESDYASIGVDMSIYEGGPETNIHYGGSLVPMSANPNRRSRYLQMPEPYNGLDRTGGFERESGAYDSIAPGDDVPYSFSRTDTGGTGGLSEPNPEGRNERYDETDETTVGDEGDESTVAESDFDQLSVTERKPLSYPPEGRPLPPAPTEEMKTLPIISTRTARAFKRHATLDQSGRPFQYQAGPDSFNGLLSPQVPRSSSMSSHSSTPQVPQPIRSKTDAEERRKAALLRPQKMLSDTCVPQSAVTLEMLPTIRREFVAAKLSSNDFKKCSEPWALSTIVDWLQLMSKDETDLTEHALTDGLIALFTHKVPTMNIADAETLSARVVQEMYNSETLSKDEEWVKFGENNVSGVLYQITGTGCYSPKVHESPIPGRCYSHHCMRTLKKINLQAHSMQQEKKSEDWVTFYKLKKEDLEGVDKKEISRQNNLHEIITTEDAYIDHLDILRTLFRDQLASCKPPVITPKRLNDFLQRVFGKVDAVKTANEEHLLAQLKYKQQEKGPWIDGFSDIFREWVRKARPAYLEYAAGFPYASYLIRRESERNVLFRQFLAQTRDNPRAQKLGWDTFLKAPITRLPRYDLLLTTVLKNSVLETEEKTKLKKAISEIKTFVFECDAKVGENTKKVHLNELSTKLVLRPGMDKEVSLNLNHLGRELVFRGDLQRTGAKSLTWLDTHAILFDHYLVLAKTHTSRDGVGGSKHEWYDVSKLPIPMDLLILESTNDDPVSKSSVRLGGAVTKAQDTRSNYLSGDKGQQGALQHVATSVSLSSNNSAISMVASTVLEGVKDDKILFPFRIRHLGKTEVYTLYAPTAANRRDWCDKIVEAKTKHAASLFMQNAEPFRLRVLADTAFGYDSLVSAPLDFVIGGTPLDRAIQEAEGNFAKQSRTPPICRAPVNCATTFIQPYPGGKMVAVGTDYGVYISPYDNARGWTRVIQQIRVTQIAVLEEFNLFLVLADKALIAYHLDAVCPVSGAAPQNDSARRAPQKLSGARDVGFFATGKMKDRTLVFYKKRDGMQSTFKVLEPILHRSNTSSRSRFLQLRRNGTTDFFRDFDEFYIPTDTYALNLFTSSLAVATYRGIEVLTLDKKLPWSVPNIDKSSPEAYEPVRGIANRIQNLRPLGMFRLNETEFLVVLDECAVYVNKHGDVSRSVVMEFVGRAKQAAMQGPYLILFDDGFVEVRNAINGRLRQVIAGKDIRCLDDGGGGSGAGLSTLGSINAAGDPVTGGRTVKICMQHPEHEEIQLVLELIANERQKE